jgi:hypothetical protein
MKTHSPLTIPLMAVSLLCGCTGTDEDGSTPFEGIGAAGHGEALRLPDPVVWRADPPELTPKQRRRQAEVDQPLVERYREYRIVETTQGYSGDIIDWVDPDTIPGARVEPPPPPWTEEDLRPSSGAQLARTELEMYPELRGPEGTTPIHRPNFSAASRSNLANQSS